MMLRRMPFFQICLFGLSLGQFALMSGCGGGVSAGSAAVCTQDTFVPNYVAEIGGLLRWERVPVRIYFVKDANYSDTRQALAIQGLEQWMAASSNILIYRIVNSESNAQIKVRFDPSTVDGLTDYRYFVESGFLSDAEVKIGIKGNNMVDIQSVAAHEFGHAFGIRGHSTNRDDMMYPTYTTNVPLAITSSDLNTMKTAYCSLFQPLTPAPRSRRYETLVHERIVCPQHLHGEGEASR